jgi:hypothetical protein
MPINGRLTSWITWESADIACTVLKVTYYHYPSVLRYETDDGLFYVRVTGDSITGISISGNRAFTRIIE